MKIENIDTATISQNGIEQNVERKNTPIQSSPLMKFLEGELIAIYWDAIALTKAIPKMIKNTKSQEMIDTLKFHLDKIENQVTRLDLAFESIEQDAIAKNAKQVRSSMQEMHRLGKK